MIFIAAFVATFLACWLVVYGAGPVVERLLARTAHWTANFRYHDYLPVLVVVGVGIAATSLAGNAFLELAESVQEQSPVLHGVDAEAHEWARFTRSGGSTAFFTTLTIIGTPVGLGVIVLIVCVLLAIRRRWRWAAYLILTTSLGGLLNLQLKAFFARARPDLAEALRNAHGYSFPSGHAMGSAICFGALAYLAMRTIPHWRYRAAAVAFAWTMVVAISVSRIYLGVHWISDVGAGIAAGLIWLAAATVAYETTRRIRLVRALRARRGDQTTSSLRTSRGE